MKPIIIKATLRATIICILLAGLALPAARASASLRVCHTDPILTFSDGSMLAITATIAADDSDITGIVYTVHAPASLAITSTVYTGGSLTGKEVVVLLADQQPGVYQTDTLVTTQAAGVAVNAVSSLFPAIVGSASGYAGQHLVVSLNSASGPSTSDWTSPNMAWMMK